jgi:hypothetical protein
MLQPTTIVYLCAVVCVLLHAGITRLLCVCRRNVRWQVGDATELELPAGSADVVFSNWLLMYLSDSEVAKLAGDTLTWVRM